MRISIFYKSWYLVRSVMHNVKLIATKSRHTEDETAILHIFFIFYFPYSFSSFCPSFLPSHLSFFLSSLCVKSIFYVQYLNYLFISVLRWTANILWYTRIPWYLFHLQMIFYLKFLLSNTDVYISCWCTCSKHVYIPDVSNLDWLVHSTFQITWMNITTDNEWKIVNYGIAEIPFFRKYT